jgi:hypothetical protein
MSCTAIYFGIFRPWPGAPNRFAAIVDPEWEDDFEIPDYHDPIADTLPPAGALAWWDFAHGAYGMG